MAELKDLDQKKIIGVVFKALLLDLFAFTIILPLFPRLLDYYRREELGHQETVLGYALQILEQFKHLIIAHKRESVKTGYADKWDTVLLGGLIGSLFSLLQFFVSPIIGRRSDNLGRRKVLLFTMIGNILSTLVWLFAHSFSLFLVARVFAGLSEGNVQLSIAIISDVTTPEKRSKSLALVGIAFAVAFTVGPAIGAWFASIDLSESWPSLTKFGIYPYSMAAFVGLVLLVLETIYLYTSLPETVHFRKQVEKKTDQTEPKEEITLEMIHRRLLNLQYLKQIMCAFSFIFSGMEFTLVFLTFDVLDYTHMQQGKLLGFMGIISALIQGGYVRRRVEKIGEKSIVAQGMVSCAVGLYCLATTIRSSNATVWLYLGVTCLAFTSGTVVNCLTSLASLQCHEHDVVESDALSKGRALGEFRSYGQLGRAAGPIFACSLYWIFGPGPCYAFGAMLMMAVSWVTVMNAPNGKVVNKKKKTKSTASTSSVAAQTEKSK